MRKVVVHGTTEVEAGFGKGKGRAVEEMEAGRAGK